MYIIFPWYKIVKKKYKKFEEFNYWKKCILHIIVAIMLD